MQVEEYCDHNYCSHRDCSDIDCSHCAIWLLPQQYDKLKDQVSEIVEVLNRSYTCFTARTSTEMHSSLPELKEQLLSLMSDHFHNITILMNKLAGIIPSFSSTISNTAHWRSRWPTLLIW